MIASAKLTPSATNSTALADKMRDAVAKRYTPWNDRKHKPKRRHKSFDEAIRNSSESIIGRFNEVVVYLLTHFSKSCNISEVAKFGCQVVVYKYHET